MSIRSFLDHRAERRYRRAFLARNHNSSVGVATHLRDALPFPAVNAPVFASGVYPCAGLLPGDFVRQAVAAFGGAEFWVEDGFFVHSVYVITETRKAHTQRNE
jgi:hypothetical protein